MTEAECLAAIAGGESAYGLLKERMPLAERRFNALNRSIIKLLADVRCNFPDAQYYTASGGFNLLLGSPHTEGGKSQQQLSALAGHAAIGDGDY
jgi:hypothetical protein